MRLGWEVGADLEQWAMETWGLGFHSRGVGGDAWGVEEHYWVLAVRTMEEMARQGRQGQGEWLGAEGVEARRC